VNTVLKESLLALATTAGLTDPTVQALIVQVGTDSAALGLRAASGENVDAELLQVKAQGLNLEEYMRAKIHAVVFSFLVSAINKALTLGLASLG
jgi:hypothetical protein